jgi:hypothetical protein
MLRDVRELAQGASREREYRIARELSPTETQRTQPSGPPREPQNPEEGWVPTAPWQQDSALANTPQIIVG